MYSKFNFQGVGGVAVTMQLDSATMGKVKDDLSVACGKTVALTANETVGYGAEGGRIFGVIDHVEKDGAVNVRVGGFAVGIAISATVAKQPALGDGVAVDGTGGIVKADAATVTVFGVAVSVDTAAKTAVVLLK